jgi:hypothetical protein
MSSTGWREVGCTHIISIPRWVASRDSFRNTRSMLKNLHGLNPSGCWATPFGNTNTPEQGTSRSVGTEGEIKLASDQNKGEPNHGTHIGHSMKHAGGHRGGVGAEDVLAGLLFLPVVAVPKPPHQQTPHNNEAIRRHIQNARGSAMHWGVATRTWGWLVA